MNDDIVSASHLQCALIALWVKGPHDRNTDSICDAEQIEGLRHTSESMQTK